MLISVDFSDSNKLALKVSIGKRPIMNKNITLNYKEGSQYGSEYDDYWAEAKDDSNFPDFRTVKELEDAKSSEIVWSVTYSTNSKETQTDIINHNTQDASTQTSPQTSPQTQTLSQDSGTDDPEKEEAFPTAGVFRLYQAASARGVYNLGERGRGRATRGMRGHYYSNDRSRYQDHSYQPRRQSWERNQSYGPNETNNNQDSRPNPFSAEDFADWINLQIFLPKETKRCHNRKINQQPFYMFSNVA